jgi:kynurenine formamidase
VTSAQSACCSSANGKNGPLKRNLNKKRKPTAGQFFVVRALAIRWRTGATAPARHVAGKDIVMPCWSHR